ncbi:energy transducer TonB [Duganella sp. LX20W]|uniref:Energy transducer TonB n=1 Tax=Rugamonas brunnea TaxID=2758569 RepID=A0A7W2ID48_9BURK|nr:TonB family protein [Rugamonas brunnea]MBA5638895.1 energy transducer TonB [Rugamonas brunnea]
MMAFGVSLLAHGVLLAVHFVAPKAFKVEPTDPGLEVILVNAKHARAPLKAEALAQANLDGGGNVDTGRAKSPLPDMRKMEMGDSVKATRRRIAELEEQQRNLLSQVSKPTPFTAPPVTEKSKPDPLPTGSDLLDSSKAIARMAAEISETIEDQNKRPKKTFITPSTREVGYAEYYKTMQRRIEEVGTLNFPQQNGRKLYGELVVYIPVFQDGYIYTKDGGARVERSSGNPALDAKALEIVRRAQPFGRFPPKMLSNDKDDLWVIITRFKFTREEKMEANLSGGAQ